MSWGEDLLAELEAASAAYLDSVPLDVPMNSTRWVKANAMLAVMGEPGYLDWEPGSFEGPLLLAGTRADMSNLRKIRLLWPDEGEVIHLYKHVHGGYERLLRWAKGEG